MKMFFKWVTTYDKKGIPFLMARKFPAELVLHYSVGFVLHISS